VRTTTRRTIVVLIQLAAFDGDLIGDISMTSLSRRGTTAVIVSASTGRRPRHRNATIAIVSVVGPWRAR
jgi:hypothetical protein